MTTAHTDTASTDVTDARIASTRRLALSVTETAQVLGVSDDLVYQMVNRGELPGLRMGRRVLIPARAIDLVVEASLGGFDPAGVVSRLCACPTPDPRSV